MFQKFQVIEGMYFPIPPEDPADAIADLSEEQIERIKKAFDEMKAVQQMIYQHIFLEN